MRQHDYTYWPRWDVISVILISYDFLYCLFIGFAIVCFFGVFLRVLFQLHMFEQKGHTFVRNQHS